MIIVDGLDECSLPGERENILQSLSVLNAPEHGSVKTAYTSREEVDIKRHFRNTKVLQSPLEEMTLSYMWQRRLSCVSRISHFVSKIQR